jgi:ABC-type multidrug transport system fused ATPase/permease subunit
VVLSDATFGWAMVTPQEEFKEDENTGCCGLFIGKMKYRYGGSRASATIDVTSDSENEDEEEEEGRAGLEGKKSTRWQRYIKNPATKVRSIFSRGKEGDGYDKLSSISSHGGDSRNYRDKDESDDATLSSHVTSISGSDNKGSFSIEDDSDNDSDNDSDAGIEMLSPQKRKMKLNENNQNENMIVLDKISLVIPSRDLVAVCGSTGSGKSTFISGLLGECKTIGGSVMMNGSISLVSQSAWIQNASLRANILFGLEYEKERYEAVLGACALLVDLQAFPDGDMTDIGESGVNLVALKTFYFFYENVSYLHICVYSYVYMYIFIYIYV